MVKPTAKKRRTCPTRGREISAVKSSSMAAAVRSGPLPPRRGERHGPGASGVGKSIQKTAPCTSTL